MLRALHKLKFMIVDQGDKIFCNMFISESIQLITNAVLLCEQGNFDCAFYSVKQTMKPH